jgi:signal transduction histidine kinase
MPLINFINNAIDAIKDQNEKWIIIKAYIEMNEVVLQVIDAGPGIQEQIRDKILQPFFTTNPVGVGTGLGLSISKGILDQHHATLSILTLSGHTCFEIRFMSKTPQQLAA